MGRVLKTAKLQLFEQGFLCTGCAKLYFFSKVVTEMPQH